MEWQMKGPPKHERTTHSERRYTARSIARTESKTKAADQNEIHTFWYFGRPLLSRHLQLGFSTDRWSSGRSFANARRIQYDPKPTVASPRWGHACDNPSERRNRRRSKGSLSRTDPRNVSLRKLAVPRHQSARTPVKVLFREHETCSSLYSHCARVWAASIRGFATALSSQTGAAP